MWWGVICEKVDYWIKLLKHTASWILRFLTSVLVAACFIMLDVCFSFIFLFITCPLVTLHN